MLDAGKGLAPGDPRKMARRMIESTLVNPAPRHLALGSRAIREIVSELESRLRDYWAQTDIAASTDCKD